MKIYGEKGGGGGGGSDYKQTPDNLRSNDTFEGVLGVCLGPIKGPVNGLQSVIVDGTAVESASGDLNFEDFSVNVFNGDPLLFPQKMRLRLGTGAAPQNVGLALSNPNGNNPVWVTRTLQNTGAAYIDLRFIVSQLYRQTGKGIFDETATLEIQMKPTGSSTWINPTLGNSNPVPYQSGGYTVEDLAGVVSRLYMPRSYFNAAGTDYRSYGSNYRISGKTSSSPAVYELRVAVPNTGDYENVQWDVRVRLKERESYNNGQSGEDNVQEKRSLSWESMSAVFGDILGDKPAWEGVATMQIYGKASDQLTGIPEVETDYHTKIVPVPSSAVFDPDTRQYQPGVWDGSWEYAYTNDPAWCIADLIGDSLGGVSAMAPGSYLNKWDALELSRWCSELVDDGDGGTHPRFSMNVAINDKQKAPELVRYLAGAVGALAWDNGQGEWRVKADRPEPAVDLYTLESIAGEFRYSHTDVDTRFNDITGKFLNAEMDFRDDQVRLYDDESQSAISKIGRKPTTIALVGCTNRQEAMRRIIMRLRTSCRETRMVSFTTNRRAKLLQPLSHILVADQSMGDSEQRTTGRVIGKSADGLIIYVRDAMRLESGVDYTLKFTEANEDYNPEPSTQPTVENWTNPTHVAEREVTNTGAQRGNVVAIHINEPLPADAPDRLVVALSATGLATIPKLYRVLNIEKDDDGEMHTVSAIEVDTGKWDAVDNVEASSAIFQNMRGRADPPQISGTLLGFVSAPAAQGANVSLQAQWTRPADRRLSGFRVRHRINGGNWITDSVITQLTDFSWSNPTPGTWEVEVTSLDRRGEAGGKVSEVLEITQELLDASMIRYGSGSTIEELKPDDPGATRGAPPGTNVGGREAVTLVDQVDDAEDKLVQQDAWNLDIDAEIQQAKDDINDLFATYGPTAAAQASADAADTARQAAEAAQATVEQAEANALQANTDAQAAKTASQSARDTAVAKATEAGGHATTAETHKDDAQDAVTAATAQATIATTKAGEASTSASEASTSETNAAGSASSAATDAGLAATARNEADGFADAASDSASVASAKATEASQSASSATTAANTATTKAGEASASAGQAASSESNAEDAATSASSFATLSASYRDQSLDAATKAGSSLAFNDEFEIVGGWYSGAGQSGEFGAGDYTDTSRGRAIRSVTGSRMTLVGKRIAVDPTRAYRVSIDYYCVGGNQTTHVGFAAYDRDGLVLPGNSGTHTYSVLGNARPAANQWLQDSAVVQSEGGGYQNFPAGTRYIAPFAYLNYDGEADARTIVNSFRIDDATETVAAGNSAEAAATSASTATVKAGEAATSATSASNAATTATNKAGEASTSANAAAASATTASTKAGEASASAATALLSEVEAQKSVAITMPQLSPETLHAFARLFNGDLVANYDTGVLPVGDSLNYWGSDSEGQFYRRAISSSETFADVVFRKAVKIEPGRTYRATARGRYANYGGGTGGDVRLYFVYLDENQDYIGSNNYSVIGRSASWSDITLEKPQSQMPADAVYLRAFYRFTSSGHSPYCVHDLLFITFEDVTNRNAAAASAAAASSSATSASAEAATATSAKNLAVTYRDQASNSATAAAASATSASNDASAASTSATLAATYRDAAERFSEPSLGLNRNSEFDHTGTWSGVHNYSNHSNGPGAKSNSGQGMTIFGNKFPVDTSQAYEVSIRLWAQDGDARHYAGFAAYDEDGNVLPGNTGTHTYTAILNKYTPSQSWRVYSGRMQGEGSGGQNFPAGTKYIAPMAYINYQGNSSGYVWVDWFRITNVDGLVKAETQATIATDQAAIATAEAAAASSSSTLAATYRDTAKAYATGGGGLNFNGQFEATGGWYTGDTLTTEHPSSIYTNISRGRAVWTDSGDRLYIFGEMLPINTALAYRLRGRVFASDAQRQYMGYVAYDRYKQRATTGGYEYKLLSYHQLPVNTWTDVESSVITGEGSGPTQFPPGTMYIALVALLNYDRDPGRAYVSDFTIDEITDVNELSASVTINQGAIASIENTAAFYETIVAASGSDPAIVRMLAGKNGSAIDLAANKVVIRNPVGGELLTVAEFSDGKARLNNALIRGLKVYPRSNSQIALDVQLRPLKFLAKDGDTVSYQNGETFGAAPENIEWDVSGLPAPAAGDSYQAWASNITATGFTANVKKITAPIQTNRLSTGGVNAGGTPQWQMHKVVSADAHDGNYEFQWDYSVPRTQMIIEEFDPELNRRFYSAFYEGSFDVYVTTGGGNTWTKVQTVNVNHSITGWYNSGQEPPTAYASYNRKTTIGTNLPIGTHGGREFGMHPGSGCTILGFDQVFYVSQSNSGTVSVTTAIPWKVYPPAPD